MLPKLILIVTNPVGDVLISLVLLNLDIMNRSFLLLIPSQISLSIIHQNLVVLCFPGMRTNENMVSIVTAGIRLRDVYLRCGDCCALVSDLWILTHCTTLIIGPSIDVFFLTVDFRG